MKLILQFELTRNAILENWDITSLRAVTLEEWQSQGGGAKEKTDESYDGFCGNLGLHQTNTPSEDKPRSNDIIRWIAAFLELKTIRNGLNILTERLAGLVRHIKCSSVSILSSSVKQRKELSNDKTV